MKQTKLFTSLVAILFILLPVSMMASWSYTASGNVLSAYGEGGYTASTPLSITLNAPADLQFNGTYKPATISNTAAWEAAGLTVPTILYNGKTNAPSMLGTYTATISAGGATAEVVYTIKTVIDYKSFFNNGITQGINYDIVPNVGKQQVALNNPENRGVYWDPVENCAVFDGEAYLQIDNPLGNVSAETGFTLTMDVWISSENNGSGKFYRSTGAYVNKSGWQRLFDLSDGHEEDCIFINAGNANSGTAHLMWCLRKGYNSGEASKSNNTGRSYYNQWCTITMVVAPGGYTTLYVNGEVLTHSISSDISKIVTVLNSIHEFDKCYIGTSIFEAGGGNADGFFFGKIRGFQTAEGALMPYFDGTNYHYLLSYETNGGNPINGTFEATIPTTLPTPTHSNPAAVFQGWYLDEALTIPVTTGVALTKNISLYAKWNNSVEMIEGTVDAARWSLSAASAPEGSTVTVNYTGDLCPSGVMIRKKPAQTIYMNNDNITTAVNSYNATPNSRIELYGDLSATVTFTKEGVIDLKGHSSSEGIRFQNNEIEQTIIVKNGTIRFLDGAPGSSDYFKGTVVLENLTVPNDVWTDGHAYIINGGTYASIQNYKNSASPGTVTIYGGNFTALHSNGGGTYTLYGGHYTQNPSSLDFCTIPSGYSVVNHGSGTYPYEVVCNTTPVLYPYDVTVTEVTPGREWTFVMPRFNVEVDVDNIFCTAGTENDPYLVPSTEIWNFIARKVNSGKNYAGKYFRQTADFSMSNMVGSDIFNFSGTYNGDGHILMLNISSSEKNAAPFRSIRNATIQNLRTTGTNSGSNNLKTGIVGESFGTVVVRNCISSVDISTTQTDNAATAGIVGVQDVGSLTVEGCAFTGSMAGGSNRTNCAGFVNWSRNSGTITIRNCLFAPSSLSYGTNSVTFTRPSATIDNSYYLTQMGTAQGEHAYSVTAGTGVTMEPAGTPTATYDVSGLSFYGTNGYSLNGVWYGGEGDAFSLNLTHADAQTGYSFYDYIAEYGTLTGSSNPYTLTMAAANSTINVRYSTTRSITATPSASTASGWYLIASPFESVTPSSGNGFITNSYDLFQFNQSVELEWENWKQEGASHYHFNLMPGRGYLYANSSNVTLRFVGEPYSGDGVVNLEYSISNPDSRMHGWNLIGNPFGTSATITRPCYKMKDTHDGVILYNGSELSPVTVNPMEGVFVYAANNEETVTFTKGASKRGESNENNIVINLSSNDGTIIDRAIVNFDKGHTLPKFQIRENSTKLYIPQNGVDYAIAFSYRIGELPLNFKAEETGVYTLSFSGENMNGVSLVDMIDYAVIDLSVNDTYSFVGASTDRADRFKLVFSSSNDSNIDIFAYQSGNEIIVSGEGELQVFDVMGRMVINQHINGVEAVEKPEQTGVYIFRLNDKVQKIVVR